jgi:hypothetical protein
MKRTLFSLLFLFTLSHADILYANRNICIKDFYYKDGYFYYQKSSDSKWYYTWRTNNILKYGYDYNSSNHTCEYNLTLKKLHVSYFDYYFLWGLSGVLMGAIVLFGFVIAII